MVNILAYVLFLLVVHVTFFKGLIIFIILFPELYYDCVNIIKDSRSSVRTEWMWFSEALINYIKVIEQHVMADF